MSPLTRDTDGDTDFGSFDGVRDRRMNISVTEFGNLLKLVEAQQNFIGSQKEMNYKLESQFQRNQEKINSLETDVGKLFTIAQKTERDVDRWIQRGTTLWVVLLVLWALFQFFGPKLIPALGG